MANLMRPRTLSIIFGGFFAVVAYFAWTFANAQTTTTPWFPANISRWIYTTYMFVAAIFLIGLGGLAVSIRRSFARQIRDLEGKLQRGSSHNPGSNALPPPLPDTTTSRDRVHRGDGCRARQPRRREAEVVDGPEGDPQGSCSKRAPIGDAFIYRNNPATLLKGKEHRNDHDRRHRDVDLPRGYLRRRRGRRPHPLPDHARADERPRGGIGQHAVEDSVPHAPRADQPAPRGFRLPRRGEGPRSPLGTARFSPPRHAVQGGESYLVEWCSGLDAGLKTVSLGPDLA